MGPSVLCAAIILPHMARNTSDNLNSILCTDFLRFACCNMSTCTVLSEGVCLLSGQNVKSGPFIIMSSDYMYSSSYAGFYRFMTSFIFVFVNLSFGSYLFLEHFTSLLHLQYRDKKCVELNIPYQLVPNISFVQQQGSLRAFF